LISFLNGGCEKISRDGNLISSVKDKDLLICAINQNCKYVLTEWWYLPKVVAFGSSLITSNTTSLTEQQKTEIDISLKSFYNWNNQDILYIPNWQKNDFSEQAILPSCYACRVLSSALHYGIYDSKITGVSQEEAVKKTKLLIRSLTMYHCSNSNNGWGNCWQGALWAEMLGMSALFMKDYLSANDWTMVCNMIRSECNYVIDVAGVQVYRDRNGDIIYGRDGDSQAETLAWNATILALAIATLPNDDNKEVWTKAFIELNITSMARPSDILQNTVVDGFNLYDLKGTNINEDGTVTNHGKLHIDYMASPIESFAESYIVLKKWTDYNQHFNCLIFNVDVVYKALVELDLGTFEPSKEGHHFYERSEDGEATPITNMPEPNEWGSNRQANYYLVDKYVSLLGADSSLPEKLKADKFAHCRLMKIVEMMKRDTSGKIYQDGEENFASGQLYAMACLTQIYSLIHIQ